MLLNLSNHPSPLWTAAQSKAAQSLYGEIQDLPFPNIPPTASSQEVKEMALDYEQQLVALAPKAVHLMGEMTFTAYLVSRLQANGIICVASTSERTVVEEKDGRKTVIFNFIQFREYPKID